MTKWGWMYKAFAFLAAAVMLVSCAFPEPSPFWADPFAPLQPAAALPDTGPEAIPTDTQSLVPTYTPAPEPTPTPTRPPSTATPTEERVFIPGRGSLPKDALLLPDLKTLPPFDLRYVINDRTGTRTLRFSNAVWNSGRGSLELFGEKNPDGTTVDVTQVVSTTLGIEVIKPIGQFIFHGVHDHWHWDGFSLYEIWSVHADGRLEERLASSGKVSYCVRDFEPASEFFPGIAPLPGTSRYAVFESCEWQHQGISVGWSDTYKENLAGQVVDISHLRDGTYALISIADPEDQLLEENDVNNVAIVTFTIDGRTLKVMEQ
jgi:hypothetical protein